MRQAVQHDTSSLLRLVRLFCLAYELKAMSLDGPVSYYLFNGWCWRDSVGFEVFIWRASDFDSRLPVSTRSGPRESLMEASRGGEEVARQDVRSQCRARFKVASTLAELSEPVADWFDLFGDMLFVKTIWSRRSCFVAVLFARSSIFFARAEI